MRASEATVAMIPAAFFVQRRLFGKFSSPDVMGSGDIWVGWRRGLGGNGSKERNGSFLPLSLN